MSNVPTSVAALKGAAIVLTAAYVTHAFTAGHDNIIEPVRPPVANAPATVLEKHADDCWTGTPPLDQVDTIPGAVIWQHPDGRAVYSTKLVGPALDTLFADGDLPGQPVAFCRTTR